jgi:hypothetical protein
LICEILGLYEQLGARIRAVLGPKPALPRKNEDNETNSDGHNAIHRTSRRT